jgi:hypothetical protein
MECFTLGVKANVKPKSSNPTHAKNLISPKGLTIGIKASKKNISPNLLINVGLYGLVLAPKVDKRIPSKLGHQIAMLGANIATFINILTLM